MLDFPQYQTHEEVKCWKCNTLLKSSDPVDRDYPHKLGRYRKACSNCGYPTYYDLKK